MNSCTKIDTNDEQKLFVANLAINKKHPFQNNKNNFNDALIIRNILEYMNQGFAGLGLTSPTKYELIYVSNNPSDFTDSNTNEIYRDLLEGIRPIQLANVMELGQALNMAPELIDEFEDWVIEMMAMDELDKMRGK